MVKPIIANPGGFRSKLGSFAPGRACRRVAAKDLEGVVDIAGDRARFVKLEPGVLERRDLAECAARSLLPAEGGIAPSGSQSSPPPPHGGGGAKEKP